MNRLVSIIVPIYNESNLLDSFFSMIDHLTYPWIELIMIDDGSTDDSWHQLQRQAEISPDVHIIHQENSGVSTARNAGLQVAKGEFVVFADADDCFEPEYVTSLVNTLVTEQVQLVVCGYTEFSDISGELFRHSEITQRQPLDVAVQRVVTHHCMCSALWNKIFVAKIIHKHQIYFDAHIAIGEDLLFVIQYISHIKTWCEISDVLYHYRISSQGTMQNYKTVKKFDPKWLSEWQALDKAEASLKDALENHKFNLEVLREKRLHVAIKLLGRIRKFHYQTVMKSMMSKYVRKNWLKIVTSSQFSFKQKVKAVLVSL